MKVEPEQCAARAGDGHLAYQTALAVEDEHLVLVRRSAGRVEDGGVDVSILVGRDPFGMACTRRKRREPLDVAAIPRGSGQWGKGERQQEKTQPTQCLHGGSSF